MAASKHQLAASADPFGLSLMLGIAYAASIGGIGTLVGTPPNVVFAGFVRKSFPDVPEISFLRWMLVEVPLATVFLGIVWFYLCRGMGEYLGRWTGEEADRQTREAKTAEVIKNHLRDLGPMAKPEWAVLAVFTLTALLWIFRAPLSLGFVTIPGWSGLFAQPKWLHDATVAMFMGLWLFLIPINYRRGEYVLDWKTAQSRIPWGIILLFGGGFALADGFQATGLAVWIRPPAPSC